ncbi:MAG TPA: RnfABCDGE type electron transport complex subunit G [Candidatus Sabulitectum sp.]|nr:RnfABCDGE type electron transport complex subunit G [Candidatus Sabulitectum sp.]
MGEIFKLGFILMFIAVIAAVALGYVNSITEPVIAEQKEQAKLDAMIDVATSLAAGELTFDSLSVPGLENPYAPVDETLSVVSVSDSTGAELGYLFVAYGRGYSSTIQTMVAVDLRGSVTGTTILFQQETPGLGANVSNPQKFLYQFPGETGATLLLAKDGGSLDAITGSTITSRAVTDSVRDGLQALAAAGLIPGEGGAL